MLRACAKGLTRCCCGSLTLLPHMPPPSNLLPQTGWLYYHCFVRTMRREWFGIDRLRLDKFMMLMRKVFAALLRQLQQHQWCVDREGSSGWGEPGG